MATPTTIDPATKSRIINHMNKDHAISLTLYLRHYSKLPLSQSLNPTLDDIALQHMIIESAHGQRLLVPFTPPLTSASQARERLVAMHDDAMAALDVSDMLVDRFVAPDRLYQWFFLGSVALVLATLPFRPQLLPESHSLISKIWSFGGVFPQLARLNYRLQPVALPLLLMIHVAEAQHMARTRLRRYHVPMFTGLWWMWVMDCFLEGFGAFIRIDKVARQKKEAGGKGKTH